MRETRIFTALLCLMTFTISTVAPGSAAPQATTSCYSDVPQWVDDAAGILARVVLENNDAEGVNQGLATVVLYTMADAAGGAASELIRRAPSKAAGELLRTEIQVGATSTSSGATSAFEKPGLVDLLGFAIEHGAIQQQLNDTSVTLSTSPYLFLAAVKGDSPQTYQQAGFLNHINASATFLLNDKATPLTNISRKQLTEWSVRARLSGDRSTRSKRFHQRWDAKVRPLVQQSLDIFGTTATTVMNNMDMAEIQTTKESGKQEERKKIGNEVLAKVRTALKDEIASYLGKHPEAKNPNSQDNLKLVADIKAIILCKLRSLVYEPVHSGKYRVDFATLTNGLTQWAALNQKIDEAKLEIETFLKTFATEGIVSTIAYTNHRVAEGSDYSEFKLLFERHVSNMDAVFNGGFSIYNKPDPMLNQEKLRDFMFTFSLQGSSKNPLFRGDPELATPITYTATGRYQRLMENENMMTRQPDIANFQAQVEIPITAGLSLPISYTYATATETMAKRENRFNVGLHLDINKVLSSVRAKRAQ